MIYFGNMPIYGKKPFKTGIKWAENMENLSWLHRIESKDCFKVIFYGGEVFFSPNEHLNGRKNLKTSLFSHRIKEENCM